MNMQLNSVLVGAPMGIGKIKLFFNIVQIVKHKIDALYFAWNFRVPFKFSSNYDVVFISGSGKNGLVFCFTNNNMMLFNNFLYAHGVGFLCDFDSIFL